MKYGFRSIIIVVFFVSGTHISFFAQSQKIDSIIKVLSVSIEDSNKVKTSGLLFTALLQKAKYDTALIVAENALKLSEKINYAKGLATSYINIGVINARQGNLERALEYYNKGLKLSEELNDKWGVAKVLINMGNVYVSQGHFPEGLKNYFSALKFYEQIGDKNAISIAENNIGNIYYYMDNFKESEKHFRISLKIAEEIRDTIGIANAYANLGNVYRNQNMHAEALKYYSTGLKMNEIIGDKRGVSVCYNNFGVVHLSQGNYREALNNFFVALKMREEIGDKKGIASTYGYIGVTYNKLDDPREAKLWLEKSVRLGTEMGLIEIISDAHADLSKAESKLGNHKSAYEHYLLFISYRDSINNQEATEKTVQQEMQYEFDKRAAADSIKNAEARKLEELTHQQKISKQKAYAYGGIAGFVLMIAVAGVSYNAFRNKKRANKEIETQKHLLEVKQKEILDSIRYAKRIQMTLLKTEKYIGSKIRKMKGDV